MHVFCKILGAIFEKWTFLFFQKCPKSKTANESRSTFFLGVLTEPSKIQLFYLSLHVY
jgi:hypothetical protein